MNTEKYTKYRSLEKGIKKIGTEKGKDLAYEELLELRKKVKDLERDNDI